MNNPDKQLGLSLLSNFPSNFLSNLLTAVGVVEPFQS